MAEQVQSILEQMVPHLKDLQDRSIFTPSEITSIVERRRKSEYLLHRRNSARKSDYLRYIEDEIMLEKLRKLRKEKVLLELKAEREARYNNNNSDNSDSEENDVKQAAYKTSGSGDSHIIRHIHYIYQRTLRKFHYPLDILLNYANFAKDVKSFKHLSRIYAQGIQYHPRVVGLWIEASSFEYFGYVAQDYENNSHSNKLSDGDEGIDSKVVGSSISNARILMQRALRINKNSEELWIQYFSLELHYVQKLWGRQQVLEGGVDVTVGDLSGIGSDAEDEEEEDEEKQEEEHAKWTQSLTTLLPSQIIYKNAIKALPHNIQFRLKFIESCRQFPNTEMLISYIMDSITRDFGSSVEGWVARISFIEEDMMNGDEGVCGGLLGMDNEEEEDDIDDDEEGERPAKKARVEKEEPNELVAAAVTSGDAALDLLQEALEAVPTSKMYLEGARFLRLRIQRLVDQDGGDEGEEEEDVSYLLQADEDSEGAAQRHVHLLEQLYAQAAEKNVTSVSLTLDHVDFLLSTDQISKAETLLRDTATASSTPTTDDDNARLWLRWAELSSQMEAPSSSSTSILHRALKSTPIHNRHAHTLIMTELMQHLMMKQTRTTKVDDELKSLFQKMILLSQGCDYSMPTKKDDDDKEEDTTVNVASTFLAYLKYAMDTKDDTAQGNKQEESIRSIYTSVLYHSNYGKSCSGKTGEELLTMKSFFDLCIYYEKTSRSGSSNMKKNKKEKKKARKMRLCKLYETGISFYESCGGGSSVWRNIVDGYTRELQDVKYSL